MLRSFLASLTCSLCLLPTIVTFSTAQSNTCTFHKVEIGTDYTSVYGINNNGAIVGTYNPNSSSQAAYILKSGIVTTIFYPGASMTSGFGINDNQDIVGSYVPPGVGAPTFGFQSVNGVFTSLSFPGGSIMTQAGGINRAGIVVGTYQDSKAITHGFAYINGKYKSITFPGATATFANTINNKNVLAGGYTDTANVEHGFTWSKGKFTVVDYPGAANTIVSQVNDNGVIAGTYYDSTFSTWTGFVDINGTFQSVSDPLTPTQTAVNGISNGNVLVGNADYSGAGFAAIGCVP